MPQFDGAWPALITPSTLEGDVSVPVLRKLTGHLLSKGIGGLYLCGNTGEGLYQSIPERMCVVDEVMDQVNGRVPVIVHVGCVATRDAVALARHAQEAGAAGVSSVLPPVGGSLEEIYLHYQSIAAAAPGLPFFPYLFGAQTDAVTLMKGLQQRIPNFAGCKYTGPDMYELRRLVELGDDATQGWTIFSGMDEQCVLAAMFGAPANIGSTLNRMPGVYREIRECCASGNLASARDLQLRANRVTSALLSLGFPGALREAMRFLGFDCGDPRLPTPPLPADKRESLREQLDAVGFSELTAR